MKGLITGLELPEQKGRGRPRIYISDDAKKLHHSLATTERLLDRVATTTGLTPEAERMMRARLFQIGNALNRNVLRARKKKKNPAESVHALLMIKRDGEHMTVCGYRAKCKSVAGAVVCDVHITECAELVDCPDCIAAGGPSVPA